MVITHKNAIQSHFRHKETNAGSFFFDGLGFDYGRL